MDVNRFTSLRCTSDFFLNNRKIVPNMPLNKNRVIKIFKTFVYATGVLRNKISSEILPSFIEVFQTS